MEIFELRYFLAVANIENVNQAAKNIHVSAGSLSKAISRLESELGAPLFFRAGRGIRLTPEGRLLKSRAAHLLSLEEDVRLEIQGPNVGTINIFISSEEVLQTHYGTQIATIVNEVLPHARIQYLVRSEEEAINQVLEGEAHLALITQEPPKSVSSKTLSQIEFKTIASSSHPLAKFKKAPIEEVLKYPFVTPLTPMLGKIAKSDSHDGWRDDKFPRNIKYKAESLKLMENLIIEGLALGYLPEYFLNSDQIIALDITGCPYHCRQKVKVISKDPSQFHWLSRLWQQAFCVKKLGRR